MEVKTIGTITISKDDKDTSGYLIITGFHSSTITLTPFIDEMKNMGGELNLGADEFMIKDVSLKRLSSCITAYFGKGEAISPNQRKWKDKIVDEIFDNEEIIYKKDKKGIFIIDPNQLSGTINEVKADLKKAGVNVATVVNRRRIYIELPSGVVLTSTTKKKKKKKKSTKKKPTVVVEKKPTGLDNKNLIDNDAVKYIGEGFEGFSKFNPNAKFLKYEDGGKVTIVYKKQYFIVDLSEITRK